MADTEPLFALLELMLRTFTANTGPKVKPGGHPEDIFLDLGEEEKEEIECSICYQILKDVRQCQNKHKFCYTCIFVWSTSGNPVNHSRCPVCRVEGLYVRNNALDEKINAKKVKCSVKSCKWNGPLEGLPSHQHTTYTEETQVSSSNITADEKTTELPAVRNSPAPRPLSNTRSRSRASNSQSSLISSSQTTANSRTNAQRQPLGTSSLNNSNNAQTSNRNNQRSTTRSRTRSRHRQNTTSPQRRSTVTATGLNNRLTSRSRIQNNGTVDNRTVNNQTPRDVVPVADENQNPVVEQTTTQALYVPHPPTTPRPPTTSRPSTQTPRRLPSLPNLIPMSNNNSNSTSNNNNSNNNNRDNTESQNVNTDSNNNVSTINNPTVANNAETPRRFTLEASLRRQSQPRSFGTIRERLNESRQRLDMLMNVFSTELDRGRQDITSFQEERERRRQEQLAEVRDLGRRLTHVAQELRGLLSQRRQIRHQMDHLLESASDDQD